MDFNNLIVSHSRARLARNICDFPFEIKISKEDKKRLNEMVKNCLTKYNVDNNKNTLKFLDMYDIPELNILSLVEKHIISHEFINDLGGKMLILSKDFDTSIMLNEEDHIRIQVIKKGFNVDDAYKTANIIDDYLSEELNIAYDNQYGYLTSCPTNVGTGLRVSTMLHLKALEMTKGLDQIISMSNRLGLIVRGSYGEGTKALNSIYQLSNQITLGITEEETLENLKTVTEKIIDSELTARRILIKNNLLIKDNIYKSYGILKYGLLFDINTIMMHLSNIKFGVSCNLFSDISIENIINTEEKLLDATIKSNYKTDFSDEECNIKRAEIIKEIFK